MRSRSKSESVREHSTSKGGRFVRSTIIVMRSGNGSCTPLQRRAGDLVWADAVAPPGGALDHQRQGYNRVHGNVALVVHIFDDICRRRIRRRSVNRYCLANTTLCLTDTGRHQSGRSRSYREGGAHGRESEAISGHCPKHRGLVRQNCQSGWESGILEGRA